jgi:L-lactate dehydrogenase complex protein LldE
VRVALFVTCVGDAVLPDVGRATVEVLERLGHEVVFPAEQTCCGQMHLNSGYEREGRRLARRFERTFGSFEAVVAPSSSCVGTLREAFGIANVHELSELLVGRLGVEDVGASFPHRVAYHSTCHSLRMTRVGDAPLRLLRAVRGLELVDLAAAEECCGFGGTFSVKYPEISVAILDHKIEAIEKANVRAVVSGDASCLMQIGGRLTRNNSSVRTMHLAELLASRE